MQILNTKGLEGFTTVLMGMHVLRPGMNKILYLETPSETNACFPAE